MPENGSGNDIDHLQISIEADAGKAASGIDRLAKAFDTLKTSTSGVSEMLSGIGDTHMNDEVIVESIRNGLVPL